MLLVAEDGYVLRTSHWLSVKVRPKADSESPFGDEIVQLASAIACGLRIQTRLFQAAGKVFDVIVSPPNASGSFTSATYPTWDRSLLWGPTASVMAACKPCWT